MEFKNHQGFVQNLETIKIVFLLGGLILQI